MRILLIGLFCALLAMGCGGSTSAPTPGNDSTVNNKDTGAKDKKPPSKSKKPGLTPPELPKDVGPPPKK